MNSEPRDLVAWLRELQQETDVQREIMSLQFDIEGAIDSAQIELAWCSLQDMIVSSLELYLRRAGIQPIATGDQPERSGLLLQHLRRISRANAATAQELLEKPAPTEVPDLLTQIEMVRLFLHGELGIELAASRESATRSWADSVLSLRRTAGEIGLAQGDGWYLSSADSADHIGWYDEVMEALSTADN
ncbi:hypothetical protein ABZ923_14185 [Streptomyces sp. NPDC046881]|uniref:hypothetical protein n=1 Tax=Streptomyces sp. NPDC046881 TaxID=3155374 RepID=UPI00340A8DAB